MLTPKGPAFIEATGPDDQQAPYRVTGPGIAAATEWIKNAVGAYGTIIGTAAAPIDLHCAALKQMADPEPGVVVVAIKDAPGEYSSGIPNGDVA